jgi:chromosomal replication initiator protein
MGKSLSSPTIESSLYNTHEKSMIDSMPAAPFMGQSEGTTPLSFIPSDDILMMWDDVQDSMRRNYGDAAYRSWLKPLTIQAYYQGTLEVTVPTRFMKDWIQQHYLASLFELCQTRNTRIERIELVVKPQSHTETPESAQAAIPLKSNNNLPSAGFAQGDVTADEIQAFWSEVSVPLDPRYTFEHFVIGQSNALANAAARRVAESAQVPFNPLFIYGGVGTGKSHLMHAIAQYMEQQSLRQNSGHKKRVVYLSAEKFMFEFVRSIRAKNTMQFKQYFRSIDVLIIDDIQFIAGKDSTQEEFFHTFNALIDQNKQIIIAADRAPTDLDGVDDRLKSRLSWGLVVDISPSTYELRYGILQAKRNMMNAPIPDSVLELLAARITTNIRELEGALNRLCMHIDVTKESATPEVAQRVLQDLIRSSERRISIDDIQRVVIDHFRLKMADMHSSSRARNLARPRQIAMYLCKKLTPRSLPEIGRRFGGRDHTTVMHAIRKVEELIVSDHQIEKDVDLLSRILTG